MRSIDRTIEIKLSLDEKLNATAELIRNPKTKKAVEYLLNNEGCYGCPFPDACREFPCESMRCNADTCSNGYAFRWS